MRIFRKRGLRGSRRRSTIKPLQLHMTRWHRIFYWAVTTHIIETSSKRRDWV